MSTRYKGSILSSTAASSTTTAAYGIWKQSEVAQLISTAWPYNDIYWSSVSMLLHGEGTNGAQNNTFIDSSSNAFTVTRNGASTQGTYSPFIATAPYSASGSGGSGYFNGSSSLSVTNNAALQFGTGDYTIEFWINQTSITGTQVFIEVGRPNTGASAGVQIDSISGVITVYGGATVATTLITSGTTQVINTWYHIALTRASSSTKLFINGTQAGSTATDATNYTQGYTWVAANAAGATAFTTGFCSNVRVVKGTAVYTANFTPPTAPLTAISGTSLLLRFTNAGVIDNAMLNNLTTVSNAQISGNVYKYGTGSIAFGAGTDLLSTIDKTSLQFGSGDFTIEGWFQFLTTGVAYNIISKGTATTGWSVNITSGNKLQFSYTAANLTGATTLVASTWYYFAVVRSGSGSGNLKIYLNGTADATSAGAVTDNFNQTNILYVGAGRTGTNSLSGYIDDLRVTKGVARYTADFTAPQQAFPNQ